MQKLMEINYCHKTKVIADHLSQMQMQSLDDTRVRASEDMDSITRTLKRKKGIRWLMCLMCILFLFLYCSGYFYLSDASEHCKMSTH